MTFRDSFNRQQEELRPISFDLVNMHYYRDLPYEMAIIWVLLGLIVLAATVFFVQKLKATQ